MTRFELDELRAIPEWRSVLAAYRERGAALRTEAPEFDGWLTRLGEVPGVEAGRLPAIHGRLMALGFLRFQVTGRATGLQYQVTPEGRQALDAPEAERELDVDAEALGETACVGQEDRGQEH